MNHFKEYQRAIARVNSSKGQYMKCRRHATVEPVFGVLTQYLGMRKVLTKGIHNANKQFIMSAIAYNLKKYLNFEKKKPQTHSGETLLYSEMNLKWLNDFFFHQLKLRFYFS